MNEIPLIEVVMIEIPLIEVIINEIPHIEVNSDKNLFHLCGF